MNSGESLGGTDPSAHVYNIQRRFENPDGAASQEDMARGALRVTSLWTSPPIPRQIVL